MRIGNFVAYPPMEVSKWLKLQALLGAEEMAALVEALGYFEIFLTGVVTKKGEEQISKEEFVNRYSMYINALKKGEIPDETSYRPYFSSIFTTSSDLLYSIPLAEGRQLVRASKPVIQLQAHAIDYSPHDDKFRSMVFGLDSIFWGIQFSYPQLFLDPKSKEILSVNESDDFPNTVLFRKLQKWLRRETIPTPFIVESVKKNVPMRLGKKCLSWINKHPQLAKKNLSIAN